MAKQQPDEGNDHIDVTRLQELATEDEAVLTDAEFWHLQTRCTWCFNLWKQFIEEACGLWAGSGSAPD